MPRSTKALGLLPGNRRGSLEVAMLEGIFAPPNSIKSFFGGGRSRRNSSDGSEDPKPIPELSPFANAVVSRCSRILQLSTEKLQQAFEAELPDSAKQPSAYARHLLEYCSYRALHVLTKYPDHLGDKEFRSLTYDMMLAWEAPGTGSESLPKGTTCDNHPEVDEEDGGSLFYITSMNMAVQVDEKKTVGLEAFARIASACPAIADVITVQNLFDALTISTGGQLHFLIYNKYLKSLDKVLRCAKGFLGPPLSSNLKLADGEVIIDVDGVMPTHPVLQHIGMSAWPGRLTLTNHALYFESLGVGSYDKPTKYDLATDLKQVIKRGLTGPLGARLFDKAVMYKSMAVTDPILFEFAEFKGHSRRDYWLDIIREVLYVHKFIRKFNVKGVQREEVLSKAVLGIFRYHAVKEAFHMTPTHIKSTLAFNLAEKLPKGDNILEALYNQLVLLHSGSELNDLVTSTSEKLQASLLPASLHTLSRMGFMVMKKEDEILHKEFVVGDVSVGVPSPLELAVKESLCHSGIVEAARATLDRVKFEGIDTNLSVMQALLFPVLKSSKFLCFLAQWEDPFKSTLFLVVSLFGVYRGWIRYILPCCLLCIAVIMLLNKYNGRGIPLEAFQVTPPPGKSAVEQLLTLQEGISRLEALVQAGNIVLLKLRALLLAAMPQATDMVVLYLLATAAVFALVPFKYLVLMGFLEAFTREMPLRKDSSEKTVRRIREWWVRIPAAPVQLLRSEESKKRR